MATRRRPLQVQVDELRRLVAKQAKRIAALEEQRTQELTAAIGFEVTTEDIVEDE